ncbi:hypothetical protein JCM8208_000006 [Rhodotorula glutinis]
MLARLASLASLAAALHLAFASPLPLTRRTDPSEPPPVVDLGYAQYQGVLNATYGMYEWRGIRYATAERFQAPRTPSKNSSASSPILADKFGDVCYISQVGANTTKQGVLTDEATVPSATTSEDCLFLNVVAPAGSCEGAGLPVVVYIHGGGYGFGSAQIQFEEFLQHIGNKVVLVSIQYRLGPFGFLAGSEVVKNGATNQGLLDQQHALRWVQDHIYKFGGDSDHVTIWGESAGAGSVLNQVIANGGNTVKALGLKKPLFKAAFGASVFLPLQVEATSSWAQSRYDDLVAATNCTSSGNSTFSCLESVDADTLAAAGDRLSQATPFGFWLYVPVVDGTFLTKRASVLLEQGQENLNGDIFYGNNNADEGFIFTDPTLQNDTTTSPGSLKAQFDSTLAGLFPLLTAEERQSVAQQYPASGAPSSKGNTFTRISTIIADSTFVCPTYWSVESFGSSAYKSRFAYGPATHAFDLGYYLDELWTGTKSVSSVQSFTGAIGGFVRDYNPNDNPANATINPSWPSFDSGEEMLFNLTEPMNLLSAADPRIIETSSLKAFGSEQTSRCDFWRGSISKNAGL